MTGYWAVSIAVAVYVTLVFAVAFTVRTKPHDPGGDDEFWTVADNLPDVQARMTLIAARCEEEEAQS